MSQLVSQYNTPFIDQGSKQIQLNGLDIHELSYFSSTTSLTGGSVGAYQSNTLFNGIELRVGKRKLIDIKGDTGVALVPRGIGLLREYVGQLQGVALSSEHVRIPLPSALPPIKTSVLELFFNSITNIQSSGGNRTGSASKTDVLSFYNLYKQGLQPNITSRKYSIGSDGGTMTYDVPPTISGFGLLGIAFLTEDSGSASSSIITRLEIMDGSRQIKNVSYSQLQAEQQGKSGLALNTGYNMFFNKPNEVKPTQSGQIKINFTITAGTSVNIHMLIFEVGNYLDY